MIGGYEQGAQTACEDFVKQRLHDPATAQFEQPERIAREAARYQINGHVVGKNRAGVVQRIFYRCTVEWRFGGTYLVEKLDLQER